MIVFSEATQFPFPHMTFEVQDRTTQIEDTTTIEDAPAFNFLVPMVIDRGPANQFKLFRPGDLDLFLQMFGTPNPNKNGFAQDFVAGILETANENTNLGVYVINLRGLDATAPTAIVLMHYKIEEGVQKVDSEGNPLYTDAATGNETTVSTDNDPIVRDVLHVKYSVTSVDNCQKWTDMPEILAGYYSDSEDAEGYKTYPLFGLVHRCNSTYGNNCYMRILPNVSKYDNGMYYAFEMFDGDTTITTEAEIVFDPSQSNDTNTSPYAEQAFNRNFASMMFISSPYIEDIADLLNKYVDGNDFNFVDIFDSTANGYSFVVDPESVDFTAPKAIQFAGGTNGTGTPDELLVKFFNNQIITDVKSTIQYRFHYIPDVGYSHTPDEPSTDVIGAIEQYVSDRIYTTTSTIMVGSEKTFVSAVNEHALYHSKDMPNIRQLCRYQNPMMYNKYVSRMVTYPITYFDTLELVRRLNTYGNLYNPMAGAHYRVRGYIDETLNYCPEDPDLLNDLEIARVNVVMKDSDIGGYLSNQLMCTKKISDRTEMNNAFLISDMIYDLIYLIHINTFTFNEASEVLEFQRQVDERINSKYAKYTAEMTTEVLRKGTSGRDSQTKVIKITINLRDIAKFTNTYLTLVNG